SVAKDAETGQRGYVITGDDTFLEPYNAAVQQVDSVLANLRAGLVDTPADERLVDSTAQLLGTKMAELRSVIDQRRTGGFAPAEKVVQDGAGKRTMDDLRRVLGELERRERAVLAQRAADVESASSVANAVIVYGSIVALLLEIAIGAAITRSLSSQIGAAAQHVQSSSSELQTSANQLATGAKEQATAMSEITTTINELLATSRQIAESAQRVSHIAEDTARSAHSGDVTVSRTSDAIDGVKRQVDLIVTHMLDLGRKSQQIGSILEIINELAEQTNILAINATIEAAGAGESGRRFAVVADEIRKLADRVGGSAKEIRSLIDDVRAAVNATVMTTEGGSKAVDAGARHFVEVTASFKQIAGLVVTTTEAAREIELSTKQQSTAVEQVNTAIASVAQATRENEASSTQTFQTASELTRLSGDLLRLIQPRPAA
ncbi:MAG TPA: methyl-accepting chemotaxis protein, partial [Gemmatimonadaceae bacterium]|nr:methyl-accepting chemotaxis protein [Gemmatimonadaceae bacterium]